MTLFLWEAQNIEHISRHDVDPFEAEEAVVDPGRVNFDAHGTGKRGVIGRTEDGRFLVVILTKRKKRFYVITARDATDNEKKIYRRRQK